ncbi:hypothetical protein [Ralstonia sp. ASV6]|uniref:hypothetical protein n=1 Tax=Ralstonia sp. ASV6 TaxID=2795124 RepID=UPI001E596FE1|nr:hypothetical protein [Ralstonia sp. ASV6]
MSLASVEQARPEADAPLGKDTFAALAGESGPGAGDVDPVIGLGWRGRKLCSVMKVVSAVMGGVAVSPGGDASLEEIVAATKDLLTRATDLAEAALPIVGMDADDPEYASLRIALRQSAAETISVQWRLAHATGKKELSVEQITEIYRAVKDSDFLSEIPSRGEVPLATDVVTAKRLALIAVVAEVHNAVAAFDYYHPKPELLTEAGVTKVVEAAGRSIERILAGATHTKAVEAAVAQIFIARAGQLYAQNYRAYADRDICALYEMSPDERMCKIREHRATGLPTDHVDAAFVRLLDRMTEMVIEAAPEYAAADPQAVPHSTHPTEA